MFVVALNPILFQIGPVQFSWTGLFVVLAVFVGLTRFSGQMVRLGCDSMLGTDLALAVLPAGLVGARLFHIADHWSFYAVHPGEAVTTGGASLDGGLAVGIVAAIAYVSRRHVSGAEVLDCLADSAVLACAVGSIGSFLAGDAPGRAAIFGPAVTYRQVNQSVGQGVGAYPAALYEGLWFILIFAVLRLINSRVTRPGVSWWGFVAMIGLEQYAAGFVLDAPSDLIGMSQAQIVGVGLLIFGLGCLVGPLLAQRAMFPASRG